MDKEIPEYLKGIKPQFYRGNEIGCLIVHGFMASVLEVAWLGEHIAQQGYTVYVPRLPGHGADYRHMARMRWQDWYLHVRDCYHLLRQQCEQVYVIGHSMGSLLAALVAIEEAVDGLVMAASPVDLNRFELQHARTISLARPFLDMPTEPEQHAVIEAEQRRRGEPALRRVNYEIWSTRAIYELYTLSQIVREKLPEINTPLLSIFAQQDTTVPPINQQIIAQSVASNDVQHVLLDQGNHLIFQDEGREEAFTAVEQWLKSQIAKKESEHV